MDPWLIWFLLGFVLILSEFAVPGVILGFFGLAAWLVSGLLLIGWIGPIAAQLAVFGVASVVLTLGARRLVKRRLFLSIPDALPSGDTVDEFVGKTVDVLTDFEGPGSLGKVEFKGAEWKARSEESLEKGDKAEIVSLDGLTLNIRRQWLNALP